MKYLFILIAALVAMIVPRQAIAGTPYTINWVLVEENPDCETADLGPNDGNPFFKVNTMPLPSYQVPGALMTDANGWESNLIKASFDSVLLRTGINDFAFGAFNSGGTDYCVHSSNVVTLTSPQLGIEKLLFNIRREGTAFSGNTKLDLKLEEINPKLAQDIAILEAEIASELKFLVENADKIEDLDERLDALKSLETELQDLLTRPLSEISADELDEVLDRYSSVIDEATRVALQTLLADLKKNLVDLQNELASLVANFGAQADDVAGFLTGDAEQNGFVPDDPNNYGLGPNDVPWVDVPDISNVPNAFDVGNDPYAAYADSVILSLQDEVSNGVVVNRASFVALVKSWRSNQKAIEKALLARVMVSQEETAAFLNAQNKVTSYLQKYMNGSGWFHDSPVPQDVRFDVDGPLKNLYGVLAEDLKEALLILDAKINPPEANLFFDTLRAFSAGMQAAEEISQEYRDTMKTMVHGASRIAIGFVPFVGPAMDICEAVTGKEWCIPSGRTLTTGERVFSGLGFGVGKVVKVWKGISSAAISTEGKAVASAVVALAPDLVEKLAKARIAKYKTLTRGSILADTVEELENKWEVTSLLALIEKKNHKVLAMGDGTRDVLGMKVIKGEGPKHADFLTVSPNGGLVITEAKFPRGPTRGPGVDCFGAVKQLKSSMEHAVKNGVAQDVEVVQIAFPKNAVLSVKKKSVLDGIEADIHYAIDNGYLLQDGQRIPVPGKPDFFVKVLELEVPQP